MTLRGNPSPPFRTNNLPKLVTTTSTGKVVDLTDYGLVTSLQSQLTQAQSDLANAQAALAQAQAQIVADAATIASLQSQVTALQAQVASLQQQLANCGDVEAEVITEPIDSGNWTFFQGPSSNLLNSYSYDSQTERHTFSINSDVAPVNYCLNTNAAGGIHMPRWYKPLHYGDGTPVLNTDAFILQIKIDDMNHPTVSNVALMMGILKIPGSTAQLDLASWGGGGGALSVVRGNVIAVYGSVGQATLAAVSITDSVASYKGIGIGSGWNKFKMHFSAAGWNDPSTSTYASTGVQNTGSTTVYTFDTPDGTQLNLCIWLSTRTSNTAPIASTFSAKLSYAVEKW